MSRRPDAAEPGARWRRRVALACALASNLVFLIALDRLMQPEEGEADRRSRSRSAIRVRLIELAPTPSAPDADTVDLREPVRSASAAPVRRRMPAADRKAERARDESVPVARPAEPALYGPDGQVRLPAADFAASVPFPEASRAAHASDVRSRTDPLPYAPTRFDKAFPSVRESLGEEVVRKTTVSHAWRTPWGTEVRCAANLLVPIALFGCGWGRAPSATIDELKAMRADPPDKSGSH